MRAAMVRLPLFPEHDIAAAPGEDAALPAQPLRHRQPPLGGPGSAAEAIVAEAEHVATAAPGEDAALPAQPLRHRGRPTGVAPSATPEVAIGAIGAAAGMPANASRRRAGPPVPAAAALFAIAPAAGATPAGAADAGCPAGGGAASIGRPPARVADDAGDVAGRNATPIGRIAPQAPGVDVPAVAAITPISAARAAALPPLANLWRADEIAPASGRDAAVASGFAALDAELPGGGWPRGQLTELLLDHPGIGELSLLAPALARCAQGARTCVWVLPCERATPALPYAPALAAAGVDLSRALFVQPEAPRETFWAIEQSLRAAHLGALLGWLPRAASSPAGEFRALRRLQLLAGRQPAPVFLLRDAQARQAPSPAALRLHLAARNGELAVTILKRRGRPLLEPLTLPVHPARWQAAPLAAAEGAQAIRPQPSGAPAQAALPAGVHACG
jgi:hypothetical protein